MTELTMIKPDDWHLHLRDGTEMASVLPDTTRRFARAIVMPNLRPPVTTTAMAQQYQQRILAALPTGAVFEPLMTLYLTDNTAPEEIVKAKQSGVVHGVKFYPAGATTNSDSGVTDIHKCYSAIEKMQSVGMPLLVHGEVTDAEIDVFDREKVFIERIMQPMLQAFPNLRVVFEHITTQDAAEFVTEASANVAATITPHHLLMNRNAMFTGGIRPHHYCLPILKRERHRRALVKAATSGNPKFFLGTDSAPHAKSAKESDCGCAGMYNSINALELYAEVFEQAGALDQLQGFASFHGADFYQLPRNQSTITLRKQDWTTPASLPFGDEELIPLRAGQLIHWQLV